MQWVVNPSGGRERAHILTTKRARNVSPERDAENRAEGYVRTLCNYWWHAPPITDEPTRPICKRCRAAWERIIQSAQEIGLE